MKNDFSVSAYLDKTHAILSQKQSEYGDTFKHVDPLFFADISFVKACRCLQIMQGEVPKVDESLHETLNDILGYCVAFFNKTHWADLDALYAAKNADYAEAWKGLHPIYLCQILVTKLERHRRKPNKTIEPAGKKLHSDMADIALYVMFILWHLELDIK